jgi:hypothetical protein
MLLSDGREWLSTPSTWRSILTTSETSTTTTTSVRNPQIIAQTLRGLCARSTKATDFLLRGSDLELTDSASLVVDEIEITVNDSGFTLCGPKIGVSGMVDLDDMFVVEVMVCAGSVCGIDPDKDHYASFAWRDDSLEDQFALLIFFD